MNTNTPFAKQTLILGGGLVASVMTTDMASDFSTFAEIDPVNIALETDSPCK